MSYIGNKPATSFETVQKQISTSNSGTTITLDRAVTSVQDILLTIDAVVQSYDNYSVSGTTLTVGGTLNNNRVEILYVGRTMQSVDPTDDSVSAAKIKTDAVTTAKVQNDAITVDKLNLISTSSVPSIEAKGDGSVEGKIQFNCENNSHGQTIQASPHSSGQSWTLKLPDNSPTADKFLKVKSITGSGSTATGQLEFSGAGTHILIDEQTTTSASTLTVTGMDSTYKRYMLDMIDINTSNDVDLYMRYVYSGGVISNSYYQFAGSGYNSGAGFSAWYSNGTNTIRLLGETIRHDAGDINSIRLWIDNPSSTTTNKRCFWMGGGQRTSNYTFSAQGSAHFNQSALRNAITGLQVYPSSNTFDSCTLKLYGVT